MAILTGERGIALISAMVIASLMTAAVVVLATEQYLQGRRVGNLLDADRAGMAAARVEQEAVLRLKQDAARGNFDGLGEDWAAHPLQASAFGFEAEAVLSDQQALFNLTNLSPDPAFDADGAEDDVNVTAESLDPPPEADAGELAEADLPEEAAELAAQEDEESDAEETVPADEEEDFLDPDIGEGAAGTPPGAVESSSRTSPGAAAERQFRLLFKALELDETPIQAILDWIDPDSETRYPNGAEDDFYSRQTPAYRTANRPPVSIEELRLVKGVTPQLFARLAPFLTSLPHATPLNVNTAPKELLMSLAPTVNSGMAETLLRVRETQPFLNSQAFLKHPLLQYAGIGSGRVAVASSYFALQTVVRNARFEHSTVSMLTRNQNQVFRRSRRQASFAAQWQGASQ